MATPTPAPQATPATTTEPVFPPEEKFWKRYSPHFELPLAGATSVFLHGTILGSLVLGSLAYFLRGGSEAARPVSMEVVQLAAGGDGQEEGAGGAPGAPGTGRTEAAGPSPQQGSQTEAPSDVAKLPTELKEAPSVQLDVPPPTLEAEPPVGNAELDSALAMLSKQAEEQGKKPAELKNYMPKLPGIPGTPKATGSAQAGTGAVGTGGRGGSGGGPGSGTKGKGLGSGPRGGQATQAQVHAARWRFDLTGNAQQHAEKLAAIGVTLAFQDPTGKGFLIVKDLKRRPVEIQRSDLAAYKNAVKWFNTKPDSVAALTHELQLPFTPQWVMLLLPKDREEKMAAEEARFAQATRRNLQTVQATWFDFRLQGGGYEPVAIRQQ